MFSEYIFIFPCWALHVTADLNILGQNTESIQKGGASVYQAISALHRVISLNAAEAVRC
jgi:hypothetical protein